MEKYLAELVIKSQEGDRESLELLCRKCEQFMRPYFFHKFHDEDVVNDLCQETYVRLLKSFNNIREATKLKSFILKTAYHVMQDYLREKSKNQQNCDNSKDDFYENKFLSEDAALVDLKEAISKLPKKSQKVLKLNAAGFNYSEIAKQLDISESAIKMQVKRSLEKLKSILM